MLMNGTTSKAKPPIKRANLKPVKSKHKPTVGLEKWCGIEETVFRDESAFCISASALPLK